jgi:hypothetical protein
MYSDHLFNQFDMTQVINIERYPDTYDISNKWCDSSFSYLVQYTINGFVVGLSCL